MIYRINQRPEILTASVTCGSGRYKIVICLARYAAERDRGAGTERGSVMLSITKPMRRWLAVLAGLVLAAAGVVLATHQASASNAPPTHPRFKSSAKFATWDNGGFDVYNNEWNTSEAGPQTVWANSYHYWGVTSTQANTTSVKTYPSVQKTYSSPRGYSSIKYLWSTFRESMPTRRGFIAEAAYDLWLNNYSIEVMIWTDNHGQAPAGNRIASVKRFGRHFTVWANGSDMYSFVLHRNEKAGKIHILSLLRWLVRTHHLSRSVTLTQTNFGWEICSTKGVPLNFKLTGYSLHEGFGR